MSCDLAAIIVAAGSGTRMKSDKKEPPKQYTKLLGKPVICYSLDAFLNCGDVSLVQIVVKKEDSVFYNPILEQYSKKSIKLLPAVHPSGKLRQDSVFAGLLALKKYSPKHVIVHDSARPIVTQKLIEDVSFTLKCKKSAVAPAIPIQDTVAMKCNDDNFVKDFLNRDQLRAIQTPQGFEFNLLLKHHIKAQEKKITYTDDTSLLKGFSKKITLIEGDPKNIKITTKTSLQICRFFLNKNTKV